MEISHRVWYAVKKELTQLFRDKPGMALILLQPVVLMLLLGFTFQSGIRDVPLIVVNKDHSMLSTKLANQITGSDTFQVIRYVGSEDEAKQMIKDGNGQAAIIIEKGFQKDLLSGKTAKMKILVDGADPFVMRIIMYFSYMLGSEIEHKTSSMYINATQSMFHKVNTAKNNLVQMRGAMYSAQVSHPVSAVVPPLSASFGSQQIDQYLAQQRDKQQTALSDSVSTFVSVGKSIGDEEEQALGKEHETGSTIVYNANTVIQKGYKYKDPSLIQSGEILKYIGKKLEFAEGENASSNFYHAAARMNGQMLESIGNVPHPSVSTPSVAYSKDLIPPQISTELLKEIKPVHSVGHVHMDYDVLYNGDKLRTLDLTAPLIIALSVAFSALILTSPTIAVERAEGTLERLMTTPIKRGDILLGKILSRFTFSIAQALLMIIFGVIVFHMNVSGSLWVLTAVLIPVSIAHLGMGVMVSSFANSERSARYAIPIITMGSIMLSGFMVPVDILPSYIRVISDFVPLKYANDILTGVMIKGATLSDYSHQLLILVGFSVVFFIGAIYAFMKKTEI